MWREWVYRFTVDLEYSATGGFCRVLVQLDAQSEQEVEDWIANQYGPTYRFQIQAKQELGSYSTKGEPLPFPPRPKVPMILQVLTPVWKEGVPLDELLELSDQWQKRKVRTD